MLAAYDSLIQAIEAYVLYGRAEIRDPRAGLQFAQAAAEQSRGVSDALRGFSLLYPGGMSRLCTMSRTGYWRWWREHEARDQGN
ncbi:MAG: hypothetical protein M3460_06975 [Actinomycetota bacterium]|nr:hypothetical protein [Actinomycetota bacterium]